MTRHPAPRAITTATPEANPPDVTVDEIWHAHHGYLLNIGYRMLGSVSDAEDVVQESFARLFQEDLATIGDIRGWLVVAVSRRCLDQLRSARARREVYVGPWFPEPVISPPGAEGDPAERVTLDDSVRLALLLVLEQLSPAERAAFVLHDVFQFTFEEVAGIVGRTPAACRQLASRARRQVRAEANPARFTVDPAELNRVTERFAAAASNGDMDALVQMLDPNVSGWADSGGIVPTSATRPLVGRDNVMRLFRHFQADHALRLVPVMVNNEPGLLGYDGDTLTAVISLSFREGRIDKFVAVLNPHKLAYAASLVDAPTQEPMTPAELAARRKALRAAGLLPSVKSTASSPPVSEQGDEMTTVKA
jgi:RNA polymerase sigma-70 factor (ECF subfamily)